MTIATSPDTLSRSAGLIEIEHSLGAHNYKPLDVVLTRGERV